MNRSRAFLFSFLLLAVLLFLLKQCVLDESYISRNESTFRQEASYFVPPDVTFVCSFNTDKLLRDMAFDSLRMSDVYKAKIKTFYLSNPPFAKVFSDPIGSGIDLLKPSIFYLDVGTHLDEIYTASLFNIIDKASFESMLNHIGLGITRVNKHYSISTIDQKSSVAWSDNIVLFMSSTDEFDKISTLNNIFNPSARKYFDNNPKYLEHIDEYNEDAKFWLDIGSYGRNQILTTSENALPSALFKGNYCYGGIEFDHGLINISVNAELNKLTNKMASDIMLNELNDEILSQLPSLQPTFIVSANLNLNGILNLMLSDPEIRLQARNELIEYGLVLDDFTSGFTGEVSIVSYPKNPDTDKTPVLFAAKIKDRDYFNTLIRVWEDIGKIQHEGGNIYKIDQGALAILPYDMTYPDFLQRMLIKDDYVFISLSEAVINDLKTVTSINNYQQVNNDFSINNNSLAFYSTSEFDEVYDMKNLGIRKCEVHQIENRTQITIHLNNQNEQALKQLLNI